MANDPFEVAIDHILEGADGDVRLALRTMLLQRLQIEAKLTELAEQLAAVTNPAASTNNSLH
jgi:hypothetical protein